MCCRIQACTPSTCLNCITCITKFEITSESNTYFSKCSFKNTTTSSPFFIGCPSVFLENSSSMAGNEKLFPLKCVLFFQLKQKTLHNLYLYGLMNDNSKCMIIGKET